MDIAPFNAQRLAALYATHGQPATFRGTTYTVVASSPRRGASLEEGGFKLQSDIIIRIRCADLPPSKPPELRETIHLIRHIPARLYRISAVVDASQYGEYNLHCDIVP